MSARLPQADRLAMTGRNKLKIGLFGANCSSGRAVTTVDERWSGSWEDCLSLALVADRAGIDFMLPIARWRGWEGETDYHGTTLETMTWASGLLAKTNRIFVFGTIHAPMFHPVIAAKEFVTADHIGHGRFGLNLVCGWNEGEFDMFGVTQRDHEQRYAYAQEWLDVVRACWGSEERFSFAGTFLKVTDVRSKPKPFGGSRPLIMNAGISDTGQAFAIRNCDAIFMATSRGSMDEVRTKIDVIKGEARRSGRELDVYTTGVFTCRPSRKEAEEYHRYVSTERADWGAVDNILASKHITRKTKTPEEFEVARRQYANGFSGYTIVGDPDQVASELVKLSDAGLDGMAASFVNYSRELPYFCSEVLPRLARFGLRTSEKTLAIA
jgi:dimethylsulfone monooxygenase